MTKRHSNPLTETEVSVIRNLLARTGATGQGINSQINARRRQMGIQEINAARVSEINTGHTRYEGIKPATDDEVQKFFSHLDFQQKNLFDTDVSTNQSEIKSLLQLKQGHENRLAINETTKIECKLSFTKNFFNNCARTIAAFANNKGGYIIFGVKDKNFEISGINKIAFESFDRAILSNVINDAMSRNIGFDMFTHDIGGKTLGILCVHELKTKPVIATSNKGDLTSGEIYYRYEGASRKIGHAELDAIINERVSDQSEAALGKHLKNILLNGSENSAVVNLSTGEVDGKSGKFKLDESILPHIAFVKEGEFIEKSGAPAITVVGEVKEIEKIVSNLDLYPFAYKDVWDMVKKAVPEIKQTEFNAIIKDNNIKTDKAYSGYSFRTAAKRKNFEKTGTLGSGTAIIYNQSAANFIIKKAKEKFSADRLGRQHPFPAK